jgi:hypothetical protein
MNTKNLFKLLVSADVLQNRHVCGFDYRYDIEESALKSEGIGFAEAIKLIMKYLDVEIRREPERVFLAKKQKKRDKAF